MVTSSVSPTLPRWQKEQVVRQILLIACVVGLVALGIWALSGHSSTPHSTENPLVELILSKEAKAARLRLSNLERFHPNSAKIQELRSALDRDPENLMLHDGIAILAEYSDLLDFAEMSESERANMPLVDTVMLLPRLYKLKSAWTQHARKWGLSLPEQP